jgi:homoserine kinase type II
MKGYEFFRMTNEMNERWAEEISVHLKERFRLSIRDVLPVDKGWLNVKWKMVTDQGPIFVKYYHPERYKLHTHPDRRRAIEKTLQLQHGLSIAEVSCPRPYLNNMQFIQETRSGLFYTVQDWLDGHTVQAGCLTEAQMYELGVATGRMHKWLRSVPPLDKPAWKPDKDVYLRKWRENWGKAQVAGDQTVMEWLRRSKDMVKTMDFRIFEPCQIGWLHWDLWVDNILFHEQGLAGIVDFDRMAMAYQEIDVARAVLSGSLQDGQIRLEIARAFMDGYRDHLDVPRGMIIRAMGMLYLIESIWWLRTEVRIESELRGLLARFIEEIHWIEDNWVTISDQLDTM